MLAPGPGQLVKEMFLVSVATGVCLAMAGILVRAPAGRNLRGACVDHPLHLMT